MFYLIFKVKKLILWKTQNQFFIFFIISPKLKKRESLNFSNKLSEGCTKPIKKFCDDMIYGIFARKDVRLTEIARALKEKIKLCNTVDRLSNNLTNISEEQVQIIKENYDKEA